MPYADHHYVERKAEWSRSYYQRERDRVLGIKRAWVERNPEKRRAQNAVSNALRSGRLAKGPCSIGRDCRGRVEAHHPDYSHHLDVIWLCSKHHAEERKR